MHKLTIAAALGAATVAMPAAAATVTFTDTFTGTASAAWQNNAGNWIVTGTNTYRASAPNNNPAAYSALPYDMTDFSLSFDALAVGDGGVFLRSDGGNTNGVLLVLGGNGYGNGVRGGGAGNAIYFHTIQNGVYSGILGQVTGVFTPGSNYAIGVNVTGNTYAVTVNGVAVTSLTTALFSHGFVGLYDNQPNTSSANGSGVPMEFDNFRLTGTLAAASGVPEPATWAMLFLGFGLIGAATRRSSARQLRVRYA